ncbi:Pr6Pr family membrane protein [Microbacterium sp. NPDC086615]|uniref:Pr6Pr family membrane protein n=1 Tax=Microbacterium sp. NPDC086615 TaxID=3154865 RepID=UPI003418026F
MTSRRARAITRLVAAAIALIVVLIAYGLRFAVGDGNPFDFFGYFTNQTSSLTALVLIAVALHQLRGGRVPEALAVAWGVGTACLVVVAIVYNTLVPGTGSAPPWVSAILHIVFPVFVVVDFASAPDRPRLRWRALWWVLPYPCLWLAVVLVRGQTDGWVPYGFLLPERGPVSLAAHVIGILALLMLAAAGVWGLSRWRVRAHPPEPVSRA